MKITIFILVTFSSLLSCSTTNAWVSGAACYFPDSPNVKAPRWICQQQVSAQLLTAVGYAQGSAIGAAFTKKMALADARVKLAQRLKGQCGVRYVSDAMLVNSRPLNTLRSPQGGHYVQLGIRPADLRLDCR